MSNFITYDPSLNATMFETRSVRRTALESGIVTINAVRRTERVVTTLVKAAPSIWEQAGIKADARIAARLARHGVKLN